MTILRRLFAPCHTVAPCTTTYSSTSFQMASLVGYLALFIGAGIFNIANGIPLEPLALLWINFAIDVPLPSGGFDVVSGSMQRSSRLGSNWIVVAWVYHGRGLLLVIGMLFVAWAEDRDGVWLWLRRWQLSRRSAHIVVVLEVA